MSPLRRILAALALLAVAASAAWAGAGGLGASDIQDQVARASTRGAVSVINYWATWCGPCREEIPHLRAVRREFGENDLYLVGVSLDLDEAAYNAFVAAHPFGYPTAWGGERLMEELNVRAIPRTEIFAPDGMLHKVYDGQLDEGTLRREVSALLRRGGGGRP